MGHQGMLRLRSLLMMSKAFRLIYSVLEFYFILCNLKIVFNFGVFRLTGYAVFFGENYLEILNKNKLCDIDFDFKKLGANLSVEGIFLFILIALA